MYVLQSITDDKYKRASIAETLLRLKRTSRTCAPDGLRCGTRVLGNRLPDRGSPGRVTTGRPAWRDCPDGRHGAFQTDAASYLGPRLASSRMRRRWHDEASSVYRRVHGRRSS